MKKVSINNNPVTLDNIWMHYEKTRDSIVQMKTSVLNGSAGKENVFFSLSSDELDDYFNEMIEETETQACLFLIASAEASIRTDFLYRVYERKKDQISRRFRELNKENERVQLDEILNVWGQEKYELKSIIGNLRGAFNYRHWLAHGRYWVPKLGQRYEPVVVYSIINNLLVKMDEV